MEVISRLFFASFFRDRILVMKSSSFPLGFLFGILIVMGILHFFGIYYYLYWRLDWFDMPVHFLGGFWFGSVALLLFFRNHNKISLFCMIGIVISLGVGILWELFELKFGITSLASSGYAANTASDLFFDMIGGVGSAWYVSRYLLKNPLSLVS